MFVSSNLNPMLKAVKNDTTKTYKLFLNYLKFTGLLPKQSGNKIEQMFADCYKNVSE